MSTGKFFGGLVPGAAALLALGIAAALPGPAQAQIDGHGPDAWRVEGVAANDVLNARMGPGTNYPVIETFAHDARGLEQITCVPLLSMMHFQQMTPAQRDALPPRWCLMRDPTDFRAGWVNARYLREDTGPQPAAPKASDVPDDDPIVQAEQAVAELYEMWWRFLHGQGPDPLEPATARRFFFADIADGLATEPLQADPLFGGQDFEGSYQPPARDPDQPMFRGAITVNVDFVNFGQAQRAVLHLRADPSQPGAPVRIFSIRHEEWSFP